MNTRLKNIAEKVRQRADIPAEEEFGSILAILMIVSIILTLVRVIQECNKSKMVKMTRQEERHGLFGAEVKNYAVKRGWFSRMRANRLIKKRMTPEQYNEYGPKLLASLFDVGEKLTMDEVTTLAEAANV